MHRFCKYAHRYKFEKIHKKDAKRQEDAKRQDGAEERVSGQRPNEDGGGCIAEMKQRKE